MRPLPAGVPQEITMNKANGGDGIPVVLFQILKDDAVKVLHSICQQIWIYPWDSPGKNTRVGCHASSKGSSWPRDWTCCILIPGQPYWPLGLLQLPHSKVSVSRTFTASSFRIWNSTTGIPSPPLALFVVMFLRPTWLHIPGCLALGEWSHHRDYLGSEDLFLQFFCVFLPPLFNIFCFC